MTTVPMPDYYRRDQTGGVTAPDLSKHCSFAEHVVRTRGKRTKYTSISLDPDKIDDFGPTLYQALLPDISSKNHEIIEHGALLENLRMAALNGEKLDKRRAVQARLYAKRRREGLIDWAFDTTNVQRKDLITWAFGQVQIFFQVKK